VEVTTDKIVADIPSPVKGRVAKINYDINQSCLVGNVLCEIVHDEVNMKEMKAGPEESTAARSKLHSYSDEDGENQDVVANAVSKGKCKIIFHYKSFSYPQC
jgi:pyruvate/2-oxoglutarate dehydrogenase complex dihydrolipoamide acyltransferase (E2) component